MVQIHTKYLKYSKIVSIGSYIISTSLNKCIQKDKRYICVCCVSYSYEPLTPSFNKNKFTVFL